MTKGELFKEKQIEVIIKSMSTARKLGIIEGKQKILKDIEKVINKIEKHPMDEYDIPKFFVIKELKKLKEQTK